MTHHADRHRDDRGSLFEAFRRHRWLTLTGALAALTMLFVFFALPPLIQFGLETWLESHGRLEAEIEDVDFNLFTGYLTIHSLVAERKTGGMQWGRATVEIRWRPVFSKRVRLDDIALVDARIDIEQEKNGALYVGGLRVRDGDDRRLETAAAEESERWQVGFGAVDLKDVTVRYMMPAGITRELAIENLHIGPFQVWNPTEASRFDGVIGLGGGRLAVEGQTRPYGDQAGIEGRLEMEDIALDWTASLFQDLPIDAPTGTLAADVVFEVNTGRTPPFAVRLDGALSVQQAGCQVADIHIGPTSLNWDGELELAVAKGENKGPRITADGRLEMKEAAVQLAGQALEIDAAGLWVEGALSPSDDTQSEGAPLTLTFEGQASIEQVKIAESGVDTALAKAKQISLEGVNLSSNGRISAVRARFEGLALLPRTPQDAEGAPEVLGIPSAALDALTIDVAKKRIAVEAVTLTDARAWVLRQKDGRLEMAALLPETDGETPREASSAPWTYRIGTASTENNATIVYRDTSVSPTVDLAFSRLQATVRELDSAAPEQASSISLQAAVGNHGAIEANGEMQPFGGALSMDVKGEIKRFSLPEMRAYLESLWGYTIRSGQLYADIHLLAKQAELDSVVKLYITKLALERQRREAMDEITEQLGMPLNTALDLIRDSDGHIQLRLPVSGSFAQPDIGLGDVIGTALKNATFQAVKTAALSYFAPLGAAYAATKILGKMTALRLNPVYFEAGETAIDAEDRDYLQQVAAKLKDRPEAHLALCGQAVPGDTEALRQTGGNGSSSGVPAEQETAQTTVNDQQLLDLAETRAEVVRSFLVEEGIDAGRLALCAPAIASPGSRPQVELAL